MKIENAIDFLLYSVMGVTRKSEPGDLLRGTIDRAYRDACSHVLSVPDEKKEEVRGEATKIIEEALKNVHTAASFDEWHAELCLALIGVYREVNKESDRPFTYGIAQKWVNMTMKYLFVWKAVSKMDVKDLPSESASFPEPDYLKDELEKSLHIPIDGYIIEAAWKENVRLPLKDKAVRTKGYTHPNEYVKAWSTWDRDTEKPDNNGPCTPYKVFQEDIKKITGDSPLDWENDAWLKIAESRKK